MNSLGGVLQRQGRFDDALEVFQRSYSLSQAINDKVSLAMVHFGLAKTYLSLRNIDQALKEFARSFEINEHLQIKRGILVVAPPLIQTLIRVGNHEDAIGYCKRSLVILPDNTRLKKLLLSIES
jgi:tetratricopeptide (TPR) repeat protein